MQVWETTLTTESQLPDACLCWPEDHSSSRPHSRDSQRNQEWKRNSSLWPLRAKRGSIPRRRWPSWDSESCSTAYHSSSTTQALYTLRATARTALRFFFLKELEKEGRITIHHVETTRPLADMGTKFLSKSTHRYVFGLIKTYTTLNEEYRK